MKRAVSGSSQVWPKNLRIFLVRFISGSSRENRVHNPKFFGGFKLIFRVRSVSAKSACKICFASGHSALQCPRLPSTVGTTPKSLAPSFTVMCIADCQEQIWYPDSGASAHMTPFDGNLACKSTYNHGWSHEGARGSIDPSAFWEKKDIFEIFCKVKRLYI